MDEMQLLRELGDATPLATAEELAPARDRLLSANGRRGTRRIAAYGGAVIGLAAAIIAVFALLPSGESGGGGGPVPAASADPVQLLHKAAAAALQIPDVTPRPDQYVYLKTQHNDGTIREDWLSVDGTHDSLFLMPDERTRQPTRLPVPGCRNGRQAVIKGDKVIPGKTEPCTPNPAYLPDLPTDADGMVAYLNKSSGGKLNSTAKDMLDLLNLHYLRPQSRAALFDAVSKIEGLRAVPGAKDAAGRPGIQIEWSTPDGYSGEFIVDADTYAYLGDAKYSALLTVAIVDKLEQRP